MSETAEMQSFADAIRRALDEALEEDSKTLLFGLGAPDPKGIFGTTTGLQDRFGCNRVFDTPCSENGMTGVALGLALGGYRPIMAHQRFDFFLLAMDQLVTQAAKWRFMFGEDRGIPLVIRLVVGRGWGQGPQHSQCLHSWFMHVPGLKVAMPATPQDAWSMLKASVADPDPVVFIEHRWLHHAQGRVGSSESPFGARVAREGEDLTIVCLSSSVVEALTAAEALRACEGLQVEVIDARWARPLDESALVDSVQKTGRLLALDCGWPRAGFASEVIALANEACWSSLKVAPRRMCYRDSPLPTSASIAASQYYQAFHVERTIREMMELPVSCVLAKESDPFKLDVPHAGFKGPF